LEESPHPNPLPKGEREMAFLKANPSELEGFDEYNASGFYHALFLHKPADKRGAKSDEAYTCKVMDKMANARNLNRGDVI
jgi:hypothetical protein